MDVRLRASEDYFSATSPCERVSGIELHERLARVFVERMLKPNPNEVMLVAAAYERFAMKTEKKMREVVTGTCEVAHVSPQDLPTDGPGSVVNLVLGFEEALKLNLALDEAVRRVNRYNRGPRVGKLAGVQLIVYLGKKRINVKEGKLPA